MSAMDDYPAGGAVHGDAIMDGDVYERMCAELDRLREARRTLRELLRQHVMDYGGDTCTKPEGCACSHARALRWLEANP